MPQEQASSTNVGEVSARELLLAKKHGSLSSDVLRTRLRGAGINTQATGESDHQILLLERLTLMTVDQLKVIPAPFGPAHRSKRRLTQRRRTPTGRAAATRPAVDRPQVPPPAAAFALRQDTRPQ